MHPRGAHQQRGYKLHLVTGDGDIPLSAYLSSASLHDSQAAIILEQSAAQRTKVVFYQLKDRAYDAQAIREHSVKMGTVPIIERRDYRTAPSYQNGTRPCSALQRPQCRGARQLRSQRQTRRAHAASAKSRQSDDAPHVRHPGDERRGTHPPSDLSR
jgi:hypothetical protein